MEDKKPAKHNVAVPPLQDKDSDFNLWYERTKLKLDAKGLWEDFCVQQETVPDATTNKDAHDKHMQRRKLARWKIEKSLSPEISKMVQNEDTPYGVLIRLRKIFVGATKLSLVHQLHSVMEMKYKKGANLLMFIEQLKEGFTKLENMGLPLQESLKPYILVMGTELKFDKLVELLESSYIETERREQLEEHGGEEKQHDSALVMSKSKSGGQRREPTPEDECRHRHLHGHFQRNCRYYLEKVKHGWRHPLPCRNKKDRTDDDRDPTRRNKSKKDGDNNNNSRKKQKKNDDDQAKAFLTFHSDTDSALMAMDVLCYREKTEKDEWVVDSGATRHMTYCKEGLVNYRSISTAVRVGGDFELHVMGVGDKKVILKTDRGEQCLWLRDVYHVPQLQFNFSVLNGHGIVLDGY